MKETLRKFKVNWMNGFNCVTTTVEALNEDEACLMIETSRIDRAVFIDFKKELSESQIKNLEQRLGWFKDTVRSIEVVDDFVKDIPDAEWLLYEMDANETDKITVEKVTYKRADVEKCLGL